MAAKKDKEEKKELSPAEAKAEALKTAMEEINKKYKDSGGRAVMKLGSVTSLDVESIPTGILTLDIALGIGGVPRGRIVEIYGPEASGKTTVTLHMIASAQKHGGTAAFIDAEHALDPVYAKKLGVDIDELVISQPDNGEQGLEIADKLISSGAVDIIVIDSVAALVPQAEINGTMGEASVGLHARMMSKAMRKLAGTISKTRTVAVFINQLREKVGVLFGSPEVTTGGRALKFYSTIRLEVRRGESINEDKKLIGNKVKIKVAKNKVAPPFKTTTFDLIYGEGCDRFGDIVDIGAEMGVLKRSGSYYYYKSERSFAQGRDAAKQFLRDNPEMFDEIEGKIHALLRKGVQPVIPEVAESKPDTEFAAEETAHEQIPAQISPAENDETKFSEDGDEI